MISIGLLGAFLGGVLALLSPCSALLLPAFFAAAFTGTTTMVARIAVFWAGLTTLMVLVGLGVGGAGSLVTIHRDIAIIIAGVIMVVLGAVTIAGGGYTIPGVTKLMSSQAIRGTKAINVFFLGCVYGFTGFCAGPLLGAVLTTAAVSGSAVKGASVLAAYALGMTVPLFVLALAWDRCDVASMRWLRGTPVALGPLRTTTTSLLSGLVFIALGVVFIVTQGTGSLPGIVSTGTQVKVQSAVDAATRELGWAGSALFVIILLIIVVTVLAKKKPAGATDVASRRDEQPQ